MAGYGFLSFPIPASPTPYRGGGKSGKILAFLFCPVSGISGKEGRFTFYGVSFMTQNDVYLTNAQEIEKSHEVHDKFKDRMLMLNALACSNYKSAAFDVDEAIKESNDSLMALGAADALQQMLVAQMTSIHRLQQRSIAMANEATIIDNMQYLTNAAIKLANCFTQQAALLCKLQGSAAQKIVIEHVTVQSGGQAIVGNVGGVAPTSKEKK